MYNLLGYSDNYSKALGRLLQIYCKDDQNITLTDLESFECRSKVTNYGSSIKIFK